MKFLKIANHLLNLSHVSIKIFDYNGYAFLDGKFCIIFTAQNGDVIEKLSYETDDIAERHFKEIELFLERPDQSIMAMAPTLEETL